MAKAENLPEPLDPRLQLSLPAFEGPLDLLLHLIRKHELEILDLPIAFVTERYLEYVRMMEKLDLDIASEYLVMAATLAHIKSKLLLPRPPEDQDDLEEEDEIDPRAELIKRLLEYQKYKRAAEQLGERGIAGRDVFPRGADAPRASGPAPLASAGLFKLLDAFNAVLKRAQADLAFEITSDGMSIQDRMRELTEMLRERREVEFEALFDENAKVYDLVITFMALLEMAKRRLVQIYQADPHSPLHLRSVVVAEEEAGEDGEARPEGPDEPDDEAEAVAVADEHEDDEEDEDEDHEADAEVEAAPEAEPEAAPETVAETAPEPPLESDAGSSKPAHEDEDARA